MINLDSLIDWQDFENFVKELYEQEGQFIVERNVTEKGKSGAKRQIDVKLTLKTSLHTYVTLIECKYWKDKIDRGIIDVLYASIEDLNASKGVIFTTTGYEKGAIEYAKSKNIDLYLIRELTDEEWGLPGKEIRLYFRMFSGNIGLINIPNAKMYWLSNEPPLSELKLGIEISQKQIFNNELFLFSRTSKVRGKHLLNLLFDIRNSILQKISKEYNFDSLIKNEFEIGFDCQICLNFTNYEYNTLNYPKYILMLDKLYFTLPVLVNQFKFQYDKAKKFDLALIVENYITKNPKVTYKMKHDQNLKVEEIILKNSVKEPLENDTGISIFTQPWVKAELKEGIIIVKVEVDEIDLNKFYNLD